MQGGKITRGGKKTPISTVLMNICIDNVYSHILYVVTINLVIYIGYSDILDIVTH